MDYYLKTNYYNRGTYISKNYDKVSAQTFETYTPEHQCKEQGWSWSMTEKGSAHHRVKVFCIDFGGN